VARATDKKKGTSTGKSSARPGKPTLKVSHRGRKR
jgi:hypothetical protein